MVALNLMYNREISHNISNLPVVPRFAPRVSGNMASNRKTSKPTNGVKTEVVMDDDCTNIVIPTPSTIEMIGCTSVA